MKAITLQLFLILIFSLAVTGCGSDKSTAIYSHSLGEELIDLEKAYKIGALTEDEFNDAKENLIDRYQ